MEGLDLKVNFVLGINKNLVYSVGDVVRQFKGDKSIFWDKDISWDKNEETVKLLDDIVDKILTSSLEEVYFVGPSFLNHVDYLKNRLLTDINAVCIHSEFESYFDEISIESKRYLPFLDTKESKNFWNEDFSSYPNYEFHENWSPKDYFESYFDLYENNLDKLEGYHFLSEDFLVKRKVNSKISHALKLEKEIYRHLESSLGKETAFNTDYGSDPVEPTKLMINTFVRPFEFDSFKNQVDKLIESYTELVDSNTTNDLEITWRVHLDLTDFYVDWENSELNKDFLYSSFYELKGKLMKYIDVKFSCFDESIHGCNDIRRHSIRNFSEEYDCFAWLDPDVLFPRRILKTINNFLPRIEKNYFFYAITPEFLWSESGYLKPLVSDKKLNVERPNSHDIEFVNEEGVTLEKIDYFRVCGSFTMISTSFLSVCDIPDELGHYGNDDLYTSESMKIFNDYTDDSFHILLYKLKNLIVTQQKEEDKEENQFRKFFDEKEVEKTDKVKMHQKTESILDSLYEDIKSKVTEIRLEKENEQKSE